MQIRRREFSFWERVKRFGRFLYFKVIRIPATPEVIARGLSVGVFAGLLPILPVQTIAAVCLAIIFSGSKIAAAAGTWVSNPLNYVPLYFSYYYVGVRLLPYNPSYTEGRDGSQILEMYSTNFEFFAVMMTGGFVIALPSALISYFVFVRMIRLYQNKRKERIKKRELSKIQTFQESLKK